MIWWRGKGLWIGFFAFFPVVMAGKLGAQHLALAYAASATLIYLERRREKREASVRAISGQCRFNSRVGWATCCPRGQSFGGQGLPTLPTAVALQAALPLPRSPACRPVSEPFPANVDSIVITQLRDQQRVVFHPVNHAVFVGDAA